MRIVTKIANYGKKITLGAAVCALMAGSALALDGDRFVERLGADFKKNQISLKHGNINVEGSNIVVYGVEVGLADELSPAQDASFRVGRVAFNGVVENTDGSYMIEEVVVNDIYRDIDGIQLEFSGMGATKMYLPPEGKIVSMAEQLPYESVTLKHFSIGEEGQILFTLHEAQAKYQKRNFVESDFSVEHFAVDARQLLVNERNFEPLGKLGYDGKFEGSFNSSAVWNVEDGQLSLADLSVRVKDVGSLSLNFNIFGVTEAWAQAATKLLEQIQADPQSAQTSSLAMLGLMQQLSVRGIVLRFDDDSVTNRFLDALAKDEEKSKDTIIEMAVQNAQMLLGMMLGKSDLTESAPREIEAFLKNPQSFHVTSWPDAPVSFAIISATAMTNPRDLLGILAVEVKAKEQKGTL